MFPNVKRPQIIKGLPDGSAFVTFSLFDKALSELQVWGAAHDVHQLIRKFYPDCHKQQVHVRAIKDSKCGWFSFLTNGRTEKIFNIMFVASIHGQMLLGSSGCFESDADRILALKYIFLSLESGQIQKEQVGDTSDSD